MIYLSEDIVMLSRINCAVRTPSGCTVSLQPAQLSFTLTIFPIMCVCVLVVDVCRCREILFLD